MEDFKEPQAMSDEQKLRELKQRIIAKSENLTKYLQKKEGKLQWLGTAFLVVLFALIVAYVVYDYITNDLEPLGAWIGGFVASSLIAYYIMHKVMRHFLSRMKKASTTSQFYQDVKRLITTQKLRCWIPFATGFICGDIAALIGLASTNSNSTWELIIMNIFWILCAILGSMKHNWYLDDDFLNDVEELGEYR